MTEPAQDTKYDVLITGGEVIDGTGAPRKRADVGIVGDRIMAVGDLAESTADRTIKADGRVVSPGFIDVHTHDDNLLFTDPAMTPKTSQGVTTVIVGNCGISLAPLVLGEDPPPPPQDLLGTSESFRHNSFSAYADALRHTPPAANAGFLVGHGTLRLSAMADVDREASAAEVDRMRDLLAEGMDAGALGFSTGLIYAPNKAATTDEIAAISEVSAEKGGLYVTHMRNEAADIEEAMDEAFTIGDRAGLPVVISHHKCAGAPNHGRSPVTLGKIDAAKQRQSVGLDAYPYTAGSTVIMPDMVPLAERVIITWSDARPEFAGQDLADVAKQLGCSEADAAQQLMPGGAIYFIMSEDDVQRILAYPDTMIGSDGLPHDKHPHPRLWGTFPRVLGHYARDLGLFTLEEAVRKMTGLSAKRFGLADRGEVREGAFADLVIFDPATVIDAGDFANPLEPAAGIDMVMVNGTVIREDGTATGARPGRPLARASA